MTDSKNQGQAPAEPHPVVQQSESVGQDRNQGSPAVAQQGSSVEQDDDDAQQASIKELFRYATNFDWFLMAAACLGAGVVGASYPLFFILFVDVFNAIGSGEPSMFDKINDIAVNMVMVGGIAFGGAWVAEAGFKVSGLRQSAAWRKQYLRAILRQEMAWYSTSNAAQLATGVMEQTLAIEDGIGSKMKTLCRNVAQAVIAGGCAFLYSWDAALVCLAVSPALAFGTWFLNRTTATAAAETGKAYAAAEAVASETLGQIRTVVSLGLHKHQAERYRLGLAQAAEAEVRKSWRIGLGSGLLYSGGNFIAGLGFLYGAIRVASTLEASVRTLEVSGLGSYEANCHDRLAAVLGVQAECKVRAGDIVVACISVQIGASALGLIEPSISALAKATRAAAVVRSIVDRQPVIDALSPEGLVPAHVQGHVTFENVHFAYPSRPGQVVCAGYSLEVGAGETVAVVGRSGSGKSTALQLLERFYDPDLGAVRLDGRDLRTLNVGWLRRQIGLVGQEPLLFRGSIGENIAHGKRGATAEEVEAAARKANAHGFISEFAEGYGREVGSRGGQLSGGQKQRIAIARAMIKDPAVLLLDEATSALDAESERVVQAALDELLAKHPRSTIMVAHRLSTVRAADKIAVVAGGRVVEQGGHAELMALGPAGHYFRLVQVAEHAEEEALEDVAVEEEESAEEGEDVPLRATSGGARRGRASVLSRSMSLLRRTTSRGAVLVREASAGSSGRRGSRRSVSLLKRMSSKRLSAVVPMAERRSVRRETARGSEAEGGPEGLARPGPAGERRTASLRRGGSSLYAAARESLEPGGSVSRRLWAMQAGQHRFLGLGVLGALVVGGVNPSVGLATTFGVSALYEADPETVREKGYFWGGVMLALATLQLASDVCRGLGFGVPGAQVTQRLREEYYDALVRQEVGFHDLPENSAAVQGARLAHEVGLVQGLLGESLGRKAVVVSTVVVALALAFAQGHAPMALVCLAVVPIMASGQVLGLVVSAREEGEEGEEVTAMAAEAVAGMGTVAAFGLEGVLGEQCARVEDSGAGEAAAAAVLHSVFPAYAALSVCASTAMLVWFAGYELAAGRARSLEAVFVPISCISYIGTGLAQGASGATDTQRAREAAEQVLATVDRQSSICADCASGGYPEEVRGRIEFEDVWFAYPSRPGQVVCAGYSLEVGAGETVAVVGRSGSGKSTALQLLERFYDPDLGAVRLDGRDLRTLNVGWLRRQIGLVRQEPLLFRGSIGENIAHGKRGATAEEVEAAARKANAHGFISEFAEGYGREVGSRGGQLSGGQKQRIAIARAMIKDPAVLLLDEATSALDAESERVVQAALDELLAKHPRSTIMVAHRLSTVRAADKIAVVAGGRVVEQGGHAELMALGPAGHYFRLVHA